ncbi:AlbA family DNA-binding domain-containing protein [Sphingomonas sp. Leaf62]|uniref:AlbA family DNA-binding domain-containing protein n=1 Tax=Sphingomonas sp. Leaf62 TaxID=1736228 RepID=UPI00138EF966|nr:ATP-binding protein [Sphingomonas sp. Leaf62]
MDVKDVEALLTGAEETDTLEFKAAVSWDRNLFVKDILALANVIDGGRIVVGVEDGTFSRQGLTAQQQSSFHNDTMRDAIAPFADPRVLFRSEVVEDAQGLRYVIIDVSPFEDIPVICHRDGADVRAGVIYFRSRTRRPASAPISSSSEMRDLVERAAVLSTMRLNRIGFVPRSQTEPDYDAQLGGL